ncbi:MAG: DeoR family transcriptional regulator [Anaerolineales bacterium]|uniref:helix-turn-helix transcriptional regulator n=1 Tax=Promineifilum sp. TaxID=2664178 RepID=UPI001D480611|nr:DeoR family transcriptional regulator [Anaerolineales bacterium]MCB8934873.1 DeoR family transcriptional regulator [Promineifilum sp.]MCO5178524.1 DeoR family transcriptional regulator [Promineifilum sp.]
MDEPANPKKRTTRDIILHSIKQTPQSTVDELAEAAEISPVTVRHHLNALQAEGTIEAASVRRKVGRPYYVYSLSEQGQELFPKRYVRLTSRLLDELKGRLPQEVINEIFSGLVNTVLEEHKGEFEHLPIEERMDYLVNLLSDEGFLSTWEKTTSGYRLVEYSCPYLSIGSTHAEVCEFDKQLMTGVLQLQVHQDSCMLHGANCCQFSIELQTNSVESQRYSLDTN